MQQGSPRAARATARCRPAVDDIAVFSQTVRLILREDLAPSESKSAFPYQLDHYVEALRTESKACPLVELPPRGVTVLRAFFVLRSWHANTAYQREQLQNFQRLAPEAFHVLWSWARFRSLEAKEVEKYLARLAPLDGELTFEGQFEVWSSQWPLLTLPHGPASMELFVFRELLLFEHDHGSPMRFRHWKAWFGRLQMLVGLNPCQRWQKMVLICFCVCDSKFVQVLDSFVGLSEVLEGLRSVGMSAKWISASEEFKHFTDSITIAIAPV